MCATVYILVVAALLGLVMGSFVNCWAWRSTHGESVMRGRSHCTACGHELAARDLVPVFSWLAARGRCRYCGCTVPARYPATELVCAAAFVGIVAVYGLSLETIELLAFACVLLFLSLTDLDEFIIPNGCIVVALLLRAAYLAAAFALGDATVKDLAYYGASAVGMGVALLVVVLVADRLFGRESMGGGDLKLYFVAGFYFGWQQGLFVVILSCVIGIAVALLASSRTRDAEETEGRREREADGPDGDEGGAGGGAERESVMKRAIPFGPSIAVACVVAMLVGSSFLAWYASFLA